MTLPPDLAAALERGATLVTSTRRLARSLRAGFAEHRVRSGGQAWQSPPISAWSGWIERQWTSLLHDGASGVRPLLTRAQEASLWERAISDHPDAAGILNLAPAAQAASRAWLLIHDWRIAKSGAAWQAHPDAMAFLEWRERFEGDCWDLGRVDSARMPDQVLAALQSRAIAPPAEIWFTGFDLFTPRQREFLDALHAAGSAIRVLEPDTEPGAAVLTSHSSDEAEWHAAAEWAREVRERNPAASIGIVTPNLGPWRALAERVFRAALGGAFHISLGPPLDSWPMVASALGFAEILLPHAGFAAVSRLLLSPFVKGWSGERGERARFEVELRRQRVADVAWDSIAGRPSAPPVWAGVIRNVLVAVMAGSARRRPSQWSRAIDQLLRHLGWPGEQQPSSGEYQAIEAWHDALSELAALDLTLPEISAAKAIALLREIARRPFEPENRGEPVQILSAHEAAGECFEHCWLLGFDDGAWPPSAAPHPFVPVALQRARGVPRASAESALEQAKRITHRLLACSPGMTIGYARARGERRLEASPLVSHVPRSAARAELTPWHGTMLEEVEDTPPPPLPSSGAAVGGTRVLQLQAACPFRAFAELRLRSQPLDEPDSGLDPRERGTVLHAALEECWRKLGGSSGLATDSEAAIASAVQIALDQHPQLWKGAFGSRLREIEGARLVRLLGEWLAFERKREAPFTTAEGEQKREVQIGPLTLRTRLDRQDRLPDGRLILIDYKSGDPTVSAWDGGRPDEPQLPIYAVTAPGTIGAVAFARVRGGEPAFRGISAVAGALPGVKEIAPGQLDQRLNDWRKVLTDLATDYASGRSEVDPKRFPESCQYCHLRPLCRVNELGIAQ